MDVDLACHEALLLTDEEEDARMSGALPAAAAGGTLDAEAAAATTPPPAAEASHGKAAAPGAADAEAARWQQWQQWWWGGAVPGAAADNATDAASQQQRYTEAELVTYHWQCQQQYAYWCGSGDPAEAAGGAWDGWHYYDPSVGQAPKKKKQWKKAALGPTPGKPGKAAAEVGAASSSIAPLPALPADWGVAAAAAAAGEGDGAGAAVRAGPAPKPQSSLAVPACKLVEGRGSLTAAVTAALARHQQLAAAAAAEGSPAPAGLGVSSSCSRPGVELCGVLLMPALSAVRGAFPLNGTYFQVGGVPWELGVRCRCHQSLACVPPPSELTVPVLP
jgi:hypothetical protein